MSLIMFGYNGKILRIDLSNGQITSEEFDPAFARTFLGGNGFAAKLIYDGVADDVDPLGEDNALVFTVGPLTDTPVWGTGRGHLAAISPQTGFFADSNYGGRFAIAQKRAGFDVIYITGKSEKPVYLLVGQDAVELIDAGDLWGMTTEETNNLLQSRCGRGSVSASIGPAGENGVLFANIICGGARPGAAGRGGMGAVMGSKNLKAVVARGNLKTQIAHPQQLKDLLGEQRKTLKSNTAVLTERGTPFLVNMLNSRGTLCTHNASVETFEFADDLSDEQLKQNYVVRNSACYGCPVACGKVVQAPDGEYAGKKLKMPEYETIYALGSMLDNRDIVSVIDGNGVCDLYGMDTISMGVTLSFVAECLEKGIVSHSDLGGRVDFADGRGMVELVKLTAKKQGIGKLLALGSLRLSQKFGADSHRLLYCVKGLEIAGHSARGVRPMALGYATSTRGGSHHDTRPKYLFPDDDPGFEGQVEYNITSQNYTALGDSLIMCRFVQEKGFGPAIDKMTASVVNYVTGWDGDQRELDIIGERVYNLERLINVRRGLGRRDDTPPWRTMNEPIPDGPAQGRYCSSENFQRMLDEYYRLRGWSQDGVPGRAKLSELGL
jgi:aldehyde:ferredoxin oxidoreductase